MFQHTAARRRLTCSYKYSAVATAVSTHSRPKAAVDDCHFANLIFWVSTHSRPKAAGLGLWSSIESIEVSTHSRPKAAGYIPSSFLVAS